MSLPEDSAGRPKILSRAELQRVWSAGNESGWSLRDDPLAAIAPAPDPPAPDPPAPAPRAARSTARSLAVAGRPEGDHAPLVAVGNTLALPRPEDRPRERSARENPRARWWMFLQAAAVELSPADMLVFLCYASFAPDGGVARVSLGMVASALHMAERTARRARVRLERLGYLRREGGGGRMQVARYDTRPGWDRALELWRTAKSAERLSRAARRGRRDPQPGLPTPLPVRRENP